MNAKQVGRTFATFSQRFVKILKEVTSAIVYQDLEKTTLFVKVITTLLVYFLGFVIQYVDGNPCL